MSSGYIHGGSDAREVARLEKQARFASTFILERFEAPPGARVLDLATGVGAMAGALLRRFPGIRVVGVDLRRSQLEWAKRNHPEATYVQANGERLPFRDGTFDRVHCSWLLEHVREPLPILREVHRVLRPGGSCQFTEVDNASFRVTPPHPEVQAVMDALNRAQVEGGGDPYVGQRLGTLLEEAGFTEVQVHEAPLAADGQRPEWFRASVEEFAEIFEGLDEALGPTEAPRIQRAAQALRKLPEIPGSRFDYRSFIGRGTRRSG